MTGKWVAAAALIAAIVAAVIVWSRAARAPTAAQTTAPSGSVANAEMERHRLDGVPKPRATSPADEPIDPRLAGFAVSPDDGRIQFVTGTDGRVIREIDRDRSRVSFGRPLREYIYSGGKMISVVSYRYVGDRVQIVTERVSFKPDGSVDQYQETTHFEYGR